jgi:hypothetical protein
MRTLYPLAALTPTLSQGERGPEAGTPQAADSLRCATRRWSGVLDFGGDLGEFFVGGAVGIVAGHVAFVLVEEFLAV